MNRKRHAAIGGGRRGMTLVEILVAMTIFAVGVLALTRVMFSSMRANVRSRHAVVATSLAHRRMEQIAGETRYDAITEANFPSEAYGAVNGGAAAYARFRRIVSVADSVDASGESVLKRITVRVEWSEAGNARNVEIRSSIGRFKDVRL